MGLSNRVRVKFGRQESTETSRQTHERSKQSVMRNNRHFAKRIIGLFTTKAPVLLIQFVSNTFILRNVDPADPKTNETHFIKNALTVQIQNIEHRKSSTTNLYHNNI